LPNLFKVRGIPTLVLLKPDGTMLTENGRAAVDSGAEYFPWGPDEMKRGQAEAAQKADEKKKAAIKAEEAALEEQKAKGGPVLKRLLGEPGSRFEHDFTARTLKFQDFITLGAPEMIVKSGVLYYEIEVLEGSEGIPQIGFASGDLAFSDENTGEGVGDNAESWGLDGVRNCKWHDGDSAWPCTWKAGDIIGFVANVDSGKVAVSKNGDWSEAPHGVVFESEKIKSGVYPVITGGHGYNLRYNLDGSSQGPFAHKPPSDDIWAKAPQ